MDRVSALNTQTIGGRRTFLDKNPSLGVPFGTNLMAQFLAGVQESIVGTIEKVGITPTDSTLGSLDTQLVQAIMRIAGANTLAVTAGSRTLTADNAGIVLVDATAGNVTLTLPAAAAANGVPLQFELVRLDTTSHTATVALAGADTLVTYGTPPLTLGGHYSLSLMSDGVSKWGQMNPPTDRGTLLCLTGVQSIPNGVETAVTWPAALSDTIGAATSSGLTIPAGVTRVKIAFSATFDANPTGPRKGRVVRNGVYAGAGLPAAHEVSPTSADVAIVTGPGAPISVSAGDTLQLLVRQDSGGALNLSPASGNWMSLEVIA